MVKDEPLGSLLSPEMVFPLKEKVKVSFSEAESSLLYCYQDVFELSPGRLHIFVLHDLWRPPEVR